MADICRLCLCISPTLKQKLFDNEQFLSKISSCINVDISKNELLPGQVCLSCTDKIEELFNFQNKVRENQYLLNMQLQLGETSLKNFYSTLKLDIKEEKEIIEKQEMATLEMICDDNILEKNNGIKSEKLDLCDDIDFSSDDDVKLASIKKVKNGKKLKPLRHTAKVRRKNKTFRAQKSHKISNNLNRNYTFETTIDTELLTFSEEKTEGQEKTETAEKINSKAKEMDNTVDELTNDNFKCLTCFALFDSKDTLRGHYYQSHQPPPKKIKEDELYIKNGNKFNCKKCEKSFPRLCEMRRHALVKHADSRPYLCKICAKTFKDIPTIMRHSRAHGAGERMACSFRCGYTTVYPCNLKDHETRLHKNDFKYKCETCGKGFIVKSWYEEHQNTHTGAKPFVCDICGVAYAFNKYLAHHRSMVHTDTTELKRFNCLHCSHPCDTKNALKEHLSKKHGIKTSFLCNICGKTFNRYTIFKEHETIHTGVKPHNCSLCKKSFKTLQRLRKHEKIHSRAKDYVCLKCVKGYPTEIALNRHMARQHKV